MANRPINIGKIKTSTLELLDIAKAWLILSLAFALVYVGASIMGGSPSKIFSGQFLLLFVISLFTAGLGFLLHELAHKFVAQRYGCVAEFRAFDQMLFLALGLAFLTGFIFAAPGAVFIAGNITRKENGIVSLAGPLTNYFLGLIFLALTFAFSAYSFISDIGYIGFSINMWLGLFNLIPFGNFDGVKIFHWNKFAWGAMLAVGIFFVFIWQALI